jgi:hypothetical protein
MDAGYYNLLFQKVKLIWENIHTSGVVFSSVFGWLLEFVDPAGILHSYT